MADLAPRDYVESAAIVRGASAVLIHGFIRGNQEAWNRHTARAMTSESLRRELTSAMLALETAADSHRAEIDASARGSRESISGMPTTFITTTEAGDILNLTSRRVRQLAADGVLLGRLVAGRWMIDPASVEARSAA